MCLGCVTEYSMNLFVADIDECYEAIYDCSAGSFCVNHVGNYHCKQNGIHILLVKYYVVVS